MDRVRIVMDDMKRLGFSEYECKAYLALLAEFPLNGYALSKASGIPRSRIYEVLKNLMAKKMVLEQEEEKNKLYYPVEPATFLANLKASYCDVFSNLSDYTTKLYKAKKKDDRLVTVRGRKHIIGFLKQLIDGAKKRIAMSVWEEEIKELYPQLDRALERGVHLRGIYFGSNNRYEDLVPHRRMDRYLAEKKERFMSIIIDSTHTISGIVSRGEESKVTWTRDQGFMEISEDYISHDLVVNLYSASLDKEAFEKFEAFADKVHDHYFH